MRPLRRSQVLPRCKRFRLSKKAGLAPAFFCLNENTVIYEATGDSIVVSSNVEAMLEGLVHGT